MDNDSGIFKHSPKKYRIPVVDDEVLIGRLKKQKSSKSELEIDTLFLNTVIDDSESGRPIMPVLFLLADRHSGLPIDQEILSPGDDDITRILSSIIKYIEDFGRPKKIVVRDEEMAHLLSDLCQRVNIKIGIEGSLRAIDALAEEFERYSLD